MQGCIVVQHVLFHSVDIGKSRAGFEIIKSTIINLIR